MIFPDPIEWINSRPSIPRNPPAREEEMRTCPTVAGRTLSPHRRPNISGRQAVWWGIYTALHPTSLHLHPQTHGRHAMGRCSLPLLGLFSAPRSSFLLAFLLRFPFPSLFSFAFPLLLPSFFSSSWFPLGSAEFAIVLWA